MSEKKNNTGAIILTAVITAVAVAILTVGIIYAVKNKDKIKAAAVRLKNKSAAAAANMKAKFARKKNMTVALDEDYEIPEDIGFEESAADLEILTAED